MAVQLGKYVLVRKLAEGGMAEVFLAKQTGLEGFEKLVVVKRILPQLTADDSFVKMFLNEARVAARLNHPNVVQIFDLGKLGEQYFIAMEYVHGEDLRAVIREATEHQQRPPLGLACRIIADALAGLHYAHTRVGSDGRPLGLVHRDVSPQNVLVTYEGGVKIVDFGIAKATNEVGAAQTQAGLLKGKYAYMSPEQARGQKLDARADVFCAGILLWELTTWQRLFKRPTEMATLMAVAEDPIRTPRSVDASLPPDVDRLIMKALARSPEERFGSAQEMRAALENLIRLSGWEADALALGNWMRGLFADKLKAQAADVAASGSASLEDFLLNVEDRTSLSWMEPRHRVSKTPSSGLPPSLPVANSVSIALPMSGPASRPGKPPSNPALGRQTPLPRPTPAPGTRPAATPAPGTRPASTGAPGTRPAPTPAPGTWPTPTPTPGTRSGALPRPAGLAPTRPNVVGRGAPPSLSGTPTPPTLREGPLPAGAAGPPDSFATPGSIPGARLPVSAGGAAAGSSAVPAAAPNTPGSGLLLPPGGLPQAAGALGGALLGAGGEPGTGNGANGVGHHVNERSLAATLPSLEAIADDHRAGSPEANAPRGGSGEIHDTLRQTMPALNAIALPLMKSGPNADTAAVPLPTTAYPNEPTLGRGEMFNVHDNSTVRRAAWSGPAPRVRRVVVIAAAAIAVAALALTVMLWPSHEPEPLPTSAGPAAATRPVGPSAARSGPTAAATRAAAGAHAASASANPSGAAGASAAAAATPSAPAAPGVGGGGNGSNTAAAAPPNYATININVDVPAVITVDGQAQPLGTGATVNVVPGVEHVVTVQRPGHSVRRLIVPALSPGEQMPLHFNVR